jgi:hypothetical protein
MEERPNYLAPSEAYFAARWSFLDEQSDAVSVVTRRMEILYLNAAARGLVPPAWMGRRCWEVFPVGNTSCPSTCPAVKVVSTGGEIAYCEERIYPRGTPVELGVAVIPMGGAGAALEGPERAVILLRPKAAGESPEGFKARLLADATHLRSLCIFCVAEDDPPGRADA